MNSRAYIPLATKLAAALSMLLPQEERDRARAEKVPPKAILKLFNFDHVVLHTWTKNDEWWNLTPMQVKPHREKTKLDIKRNNKVKRIVAALSVHRIAMSSKLKTNRWPKRKLRSRPLRSLSARR